MSYSDRYTHEICNGSSGVRLSDEALKIIEEESRKQGVTKTAVIEMALRLYAKRRTK